MRLMRPLLLLAGVLFPQVIAQSPNMPPITVKVRLTHNRIVVPSKINELPFTLLLDSACTIPTLHPEVIDELKLQPSGNVPIVGIAGEERAPTYRGVVIEMGEARHAPRRVASIPSERSESRRRRDGVVGSSLFKQFVVEMDPRATVIRLHSPTNFNYTGNGEVIPFRFRRGDEIPIVTASVVLPDREPISAEFEVDTGCDSGLCLGARFVEDYRLLESGKSRASEKFGIGGSVETKSGAIPIFRLGKLDVAKVQTDFFKSGSPVDEPMVGHIGMGVFHEYKVFLDYARKRLIIESY